MTDRQALELAINALARINDAGVTVCCCLDQKAGGCECHEIAQRALVKIKMHWKDAP